MKLLQSLLTGLMEESHVKHKLYTYLVDVTLASMNLDKRDGGQHMLKYMKNNPITDNAVSFDQNFVGQYSNRQYDIFVGANTAIRYVECKSYDESTYFGTTEHVEQLLGYLFQPNLTLLSQLRYVFNADKLTPQQAKEKMQAVFRKNATLIFNTLNPSGKFQQLFGNITTVQEFLDDVVPLMSTYDFVITN